MAEGFEDGAGEFGDFVEEEDAEVGERDFAWFGFSAAANDGDGGGGVVWGAVRASGDDLIGFAGEGVDFGDGDLLLGGGWWKELAAARARRVLPAPGGPEMRML